MSARTSPTSHGGAAHRAGTRERPRGIRWDRIGRCALLAVLALVVYLYIGPTSSWISTYREAKRRSAELAGLRAENERLRARRDELRDPETLEAEARRQGMVRAGEKAYVVRGLPAD